MLSRVEELRGQSIPECDSSPSALLRRRGMKNRGDTRPFRTLGREIIPGSIAEIGYLNLGGLDQWVMIRGVSVANPLLILLHGGLIVQRKWLTRFVEVQYRKRPLMGVALSNAHRRS